MVTDQTKPTDEITFSQELLRKGTHMFALVIPGSYYFLNLTKVEMLLIMVPITMLMFLIDIARLRNWALWRKFVVHFGGGMIRPHEDNGNFTGATYILITICLAVALFDRNIAIAALAFIIVGDTFAALIGRKFGRLRFGRKSVEGSLGCLLGTLLVVLVVPDLHISVGIIGAVTATVTEALSVKIDDNVSVPLVSGLVMTLAERIIHYS